MTLVTVTLEASSQHDTHKCSVDPSVVVNPPAIQYFKGVTYDAFTLKLKQPEDNREKQITEFIVKVLSSKQYPNPPICSEHKARQFAKTHVAEMLRKLKHTTKTTLRINI